MNAKKRVGWWGKYKKSCSKMGVCIRITVMHRQVALTPRHVTSHHIALEWRIARAGGRERWKNCVIHASRVTRRVRDWWIWSELRNNRSGESAYCAAATKWSVRTLNECNALLYVPLPNSLYSHKTWTLLYGLRGAFDYTLSTQLLFYCTTHIRIL